MASRDNQTMQAIVIVLTLLVIGLGVGLLLVNNAKKTAQAQAKSAEDRAREAQNSENKAQQEANTYKQWMGFQEADNLQSLQESFDEDMQRFGGTFDADRRFYRTILEYLSEENRKLALSEVAAKEQVQELKSRLLVLEGQNEAKVKQFQDAASKAEQDAAGERRKFGKDLKRITDEKNQIAGQLDEQREKFDQQTAKFESEIKELNNKIAQLDHSNEILRSRQIDPDPIAQPADGRITWVNQRQQKVWIDLGEADQLRPQITFSVFGTNESNPLKAVKKGSLEVTRILDAHMAEARITSGEPTKPLMPGDKIYSQVWDRGRKIGFAITGFIDFDDDGKTELDKLRKIIEINSGKVDAYVDKNGKLEGEMNVNTRYLILGEYPEDPRRSDFRASWAKMSEEADTLGVETITLNEFLSLMGWQADNKVVKLGPGARPDDFKAHPSEMTKPRDTSSTSEVFRKRAHQLGY